MPLAIRTTPPNAHSRFSSPGINAPSGNHGAVVPRSSASSSPTLPKERQTAAKHNGTPHSSSWKDAVSLGPILEDEAQTDFREASQKNTLSRGPKTGTSTDASFRPSLPHRKSPISPPSNMAMRDRSRRVISVSPPKSTRKIKFLDSEGPQSLTSEPRPV